MLDKIVYGGSKGNGHKKSSLPHQFCDTHRTLSRLMSDSAWTKTIHI